MRLSLNRPDLAAKPTTEPRRYVARICQIANVGMQKVFEPHYPPEPKLGVAFELESGAIVARTVTVSGSMFSPLFLGQ